MGTGGGRGMVESMPISEARDKLTALADELAERLSQGLQPATMMITRRGKPVLDVMPHEVFEGIMETLEVLGDPEVFAALQKSIDQARQGKTRSLAEVKRRLGL